MSGTDFSLPDWQGEDSDASLVLDNSRRVNNRSTHSTHQHRPTYHASNDVPKYSDYGQSFRSSSHADDRGHTAQHVYDKENRRNAGFGGVGHDIKNDSNLRDRQQSQQTKVGHVSSSTTTPSEQRIDVLETKSWLLSQIEKLTLVTESMQNVKKLIGEEIDMDKKVRISFPSVFILKYVI